jgi:hypothetical protein
MLQQQNLIFKQQADSMEKNQENIRKLLEKGNFVNVNDGSKQNIILFHEMLKPIKKEVLFIEYGFLF